MAEIKASSKDLGKGLKLKIGAPVTVKVLPKSVARVRLVGMFFDLEKAFLLPNALPGIQALGQEYPSHPKANLLIVGHADTSGGDEANLDLSLERSESISAYIQEKVDAWDAFFSKPAPKTWGIREIQLMLSALPDRKSAHFRGRADGVERSDTTAAVTEFQGRNGLKGDGIIGSVTRKAIIKAYMQAGKAKLPDDPAIRPTVTTHGAGESFPAVDTGDGKREQDNRRVELFFFDGPIDPKPPGNKSRKGSKEYPRWLDAVTATIDFTVAEEGPRTLSIRLHDDKTSPLAGAAFQVTIGDNVSSIAKADGIGLASITLPEACPAQVLIEWGPSGSQAPFPLRQEILVECEAGTDEDQALAKLNNIGYPFQLGLETAVKAFQSDYRVDDSPQPKGLAGGKLPPDTRARLFDIYGDLNLDASLDAA
jgi:outer membrane protein OmpA-like peptidoglycan-associated protein